MNPQATGATQRESETGPILEMRGIYRSFIKDRQEIPVLQDVNLAIQRDEIVCLVGESGCGKTTAGKIITGLLEPSQGDILIEGRSMTDYKGREKSLLRRQLQIVHQDPFASLNPAHTIGDILSFPLKRHHLTKGGAALKRRIWELLTMVDLTPPGDIVNKYPHQLSGGQRQRVSIARSLTVGPKLIVADEAVSMVDVSIRITLLKMLQRLQRELGLTIVFITHDLALAKYFAWEGRIAVMYLGRIVEIGRTPEVIANPSHPYTRALLAAVPEADPDMTRQKQALQLRSDEIPKLTDIPTGCAFHPRCPFFVPGACDTVVPQLAAAPGFEQQVACIPVQQGMALRETAE
ncbi:MAG: ABC transporter ATP-binding protein [Anaerolineaceae bacterium]|nr:ABC transporter ATP-binding protein [Anaerolineaceae bacterium]